MIADNANAGESDDAFRATIWTAFVDGAKGNGRFHATLARWSALAATHAFYQALHILWTSVGPSLRDADKGNGLARADAEATITALVDVAQIELPTRRFRFKGSRPTSELLHAVSGGAGELPQFVEWACERGDAPGALALMLATYSRLPDAGTVNGGWREVGSVNGDHQPGLLRMSAMIQEHLAERPSIAESLIWATRTFILWPHEQVAQTKFPQFTFRFRWEGGRLRFYSSSELHDEMPALGDIRSGALSTLNQDLGYCERTGQGLRLTQAGKAFVREVVG